VRHLWFLKRSLWRFPSCGLSCRAVWHKSADTSLEHNASIVNKEKCSHTLKRAAVFSFQKPPNSYQTARSDILETVSVNKYFV
jgi:hypothetical protein